MRPFLQLTRPGNALMAMAGAAVGGVAAMGRAPHWDGLALGAFAAGLGVAGGNALNDALDAAIDRTAHPERPVARGALSPSHAQAFAWPLLGLAVLAGAAANPAAGTTTLLMLGALLAYEFGAKRGGLVGNLLVGINVGTLFVLGALSAASPADPLGGWPALGGTRFVRPFVMAVLAALLTVARELVKGAEDEPHDRARRATFAVRHGAAAARRLASALSLAALVLALVPVALRWFDGYYVLGLAPLALLVLAVPFVDAPRTGQRLLKAAMLAGFIPFLATALI